MKKLPAPSRRHGYRILGFWTCAQVKKHAADPMARVLTLVRRQKKQHAVWLLARGRSLVLPRCEFGFMLGLLAREAFFAASLDLRASFGDLLQTIFAPRQLVGYRHAVRNVRLVRSLGFGREFGDFNCASILPACS